MCSLVQSRLGIETVMHMAIRHRNLLVLHSDLLGAHALGVRNLFPVTGDVPLTCDYPKATALADLTASGLVRMIVGFNHGVDAAGREIDQPMSFFIGSALNLGAPDMDRELGAMERKVEAGVYSILTQPVYDPDIVGRVAARIGGFPLPLLMGVLPLGSVRHARFLHHEVLGITIPDATFARLESAEDAAAEGIAISQELLRDSFGRIRPPAALNSSMTSTLRAFQSCSASHRLKVPSLSDCLHKIMRRRGPLLAVVWTSPERAPGCVLFPYNI
jgi:homocysteine S-methyltransferase